MKNYIIEWEERQTYSTIIKANNDEEAINKFKVGDYEEAHDSGEAPTATNIVITEVYED